jgi:phospholipid/cholesterol/gamma-HCH transport system substrate-binding protein
VRRGGVGAIASSPTMVGAITTLIVILAVFLAYNANNGLPFVPSYRLSVELPNAETLVKGNDVRVAGIRVGFVESVVPVAHENGRVTAQANLKLDKTVDPIPKGSTVVVRSRSALGLKYLEIDLSKSGQGYPEGSTLPLSAARPNPVQFDQLLNTFDAPTRTAIRTNLTQFGNALAGRGPQVNEALGALRPLLERLRPVAKNLGSQKTGLVRFFRAAADISAEVAPVAETQAHMFVSLDTTFAAFASVARPFIQETISETPPTLDTLTRTSPKIDTFLRHSAGFFADLRPGVHALKVNSPAIASALETGARVLPDTPELNAQLPPTAEALERFANDPGVQAGIQRSTQTARLLTPTVRFVAPAQSVCNYGTLLFRNAEQLFEIGDGIGTGQRFVVMSSPGGPNNETSPSSAPANQEGNETNPNGKPLANFLHANPYPNTASPGQHPFECEAGNEGYIVGQKIIGNVPGNQGIITEGQTNKQKRGAGLK